MQLHDPWAARCCSLLVPLLLRAPRGAGAAGAALSGARRRARGRAGAARALALAAAGAARRGAWRCWCVALARPQLGKAATQVFTEGIDIMLAVDISGSMLAEDFHGRRPARQPPRGGEVGGAQSSSSSGPAIASAWCCSPRGRTRSAPLTLDHGWLLQNLERAEVGMIEDGTAVGSALATAVNRLEASDAKSKIVILLTDGQSNAGKVPPLTAAEAAKTLGYRVYTIGAGTRGMRAVSRRPMPFGNRVYVSRCRSTSTRTRCKRSPRSPAGATSAPPTRRRLQQIYDEIDQLEKSPQEGLQYLEYHELYVWLALPALLLLAGEAMLAQTWLRVLP